MKYLLLWLSTMLLSMGPVEIPCHFTIVEKESAPYIEEHMINIPICEEIKMEEAVYVEPEPIVEERFTDREKQLLAQLVQAEAGNQDLEGMRLVIDVVLNRVRDGRFPNSIEGVIFEPGQFSVIADGAFDRAAWNLSDQAWEAVRLEGLDQIDSGILYFSTTPVNGSGFWRHGGHWFSY